MNIQWQISSNYKIIKWVLVIVEKSSFIELLLKMTIIYPIIRNHCTNLIYIVEEFELYYSTLPQWYSDVILALFKINPPKSKCNMRVKWSLLETQAE